MSTSSTQFDNYYQGEKLYGGCYSKDELDKVKPSGKFFIINLQDSTDGDGTHWTCVVDFLPNHVIFTDPFGISPAPPIVSFMAKSPKLAIYSTLDYQSIDSENCGSFCAYFIDELLKGHSLQNFDKDLTSHPSQKNEKIAYNVGLVREPQ
jgi:hypothetical protein